MLPAMGAHLRDAQEDARLGRKTLVTTLGDGIGQAIYVFCLVAGMTPLLSRRCRRARHMGRCSPSSPCPRFLSPSVERCWLGQGMRGTGCSPGNGAYAFSAFWLLFGLAINALLVSGLGPIRPLSSP